MMKIVKKIFKNNTDFSIGMNDFSNYCKNHILLIVITIVIIALAHGINIFYNNIGIDSQLFLQNPEYEYNWNELGRFGLLYERNALYLNPFSSYYAGILMFIFLVLSCILMYYTFYKISNKDFGLINICIPLLCFTHPVFVEQFLFKLQCAEIACSAFLTCLATLWIFTWIKNNNYIYSILGTLCLVICFASYQAFLFIYVTMCIFGFILLYEDEEERSYFKVILKLLVTFFIAFAIYELIINYLFKYVGLHNILHWRTESKKQVVLTILDHMKNVLIGSGPHYNLGYLFGIVFCIGVLIYKLIKDKNNAKSKIWYMLAFAMLIMSPFFLSMLQGGVPLLRSQLALPYAEAFLIMFSTYYFYKNNILKYVSLILIFCVFGAQMSISQTFYYTDMQKTDFEIEISNQLIHDLKERGIEEKSTIAIIGHKEPKLNKACITGEIAGISSYNVNYFAYPYYVYSTSDILGVWRCLGYDYKACSSKQAEEARRVVESEGMPNWPEEGSIKNCGEYYLIKLSDDDLPW